MRKQLARLVWAAVMGLLVACALAVRFADAPPPLLGGVGVLGLVFFMLAASAWRLENRLGQGIGELGRGLGALVKLDLSVRGTVKADDEISKALKQYNASAWELSGAVKTARKAAHNVTQAAQQLDGGMASLGRVATQQDAALDGIATALSLAREGAGSTETQAAASDHAAQMVARLVGNAAQQVQRVADQGAAMGQALAAMRGMADQVGLLALNGAIEAARAGEAGHRFGLVADDVKRWAAQAAVIGEQIDGAVVEVRASMATAQGALDEVQGMARRLVGASAPVVQAVARQRQVLADIAAALKVCREQWPDVARKVEEAQGARMRLAEQALELGRQTERFKV